MGRTIKFRVWDRIFKMLISWEEICAESAIGTEYWLASPEQHIPLQFTGMLDKHGKDIYDGDILQIQNIYSGEQIAQVIWGKVANLHVWMVGETWLLQFTGGTEGPLYPYCEELSGYKVSIIGNIYEHQHLIEQGIA